MFGDLMERTAGRFVSEAPAPTVLAVIPTLNEERHIETCIRSLMDGDERLRRVPLTIADGGSTDRTVQIVEKMKQEFPNLRILRNPKTLQSAALNLAAMRHSSEKTRYLIRCDAHSIYPKNFIIDVADALDTTKAASVVIPMDAVGETCFEKANAWIVDTPLGSGGSAHRGGKKSGYVDHGHHAGFDLAVFKMIGGYDESFSHNEDAEYDERLVQARGRIYLDSDIRIRYVPRGNVAALARQYFNYGKGRARTARKHKRPLKLRQAAPLMALLGSVTGLILWPVFPLLAILPAGYLGLLAIASIGVAVWKRSMCGLLAGLASGTMHMSWAMGFLRETLFPQMDQRAFPLVFRRKTL